MNHAWERIFGDRLVDGDVEWRLHVSRYRYAAGFVSGSDVVVDAACGSGYGAEYLGGVYCGVDQMRRSGDARFITADLTRWTPDFAYDVWVGLETIEHLPELDHYVTQARRASKFIIISTPIIPTTHFNQHHVRNLTSSEVVRLFESSDWQLFDMLTQQDGVYGLFAFERVR